MKRLHVPLSIAAIVLVWIAPGCSNEPSGLMDPAEERSGGPAPLVRGEASEDVVPGSYIVVFNPTVTDVDRAIDEMSVRLGIQTKYRYRYALEGFAAQLQPQTVDALRTDPRVAYIEEDKIAHAVTSQHDPPSWGLDRDDQHPLPLDYIYRYYETGAGVDAYIIDTGIRMTHSDFGGRAVPGIDVITPGGDASDGNGHGTHVAGTVGGAAYGVAKAVRLIAVRVLDNSGNGTYAQVIAGVDWVTGDHTTTPAVANMSFVGPTSPALDHAVRKAIQDGIVCCVAAGNYAVDVSDYSPARVAAAITVAASDIDDEWAYFSNFGSGVDLIAPGVNIASDWNASDTATRTISGTSQAAPHVTGAAALYLEANPGATPAQVASGLVSIATPDAINGVPAGTVNLLLYTLGSPPPPPAAPTPVSPADGSTWISTSPTLTWNASEEAGSYGAQVATDIGFTNLVSDQTGITGTSTTVTNLAFDTVYYWRVNATNDGGTSPWSSVWSFTTGSPPVAPTLVSPPNGANNVSRTPTLVWNASAAATSYRLQVSTTPGFTTTVYDQAGIVSTSMTLPQLGRKVRYYWHVNATNDFGTSAWSSTWNFRTRNN